LASVCYLSMPMASANVVELNDSNFDSVVTEALEPLLVDFWAPWCAPCRMLTPVVEEIAGENAGKFKVTKVNVDESPAVSEKFGIRSIPTLLFFKAGVKRDQTVGVLGKAEIIRRLEALA
jgi:thioredoxin 1